MTPFVFCFLPSFCRTVTNIYQAPTMYPARCSGVRLQARTRDHPNLSGMLGAVDRVLPLAFLYCLLLHPCLKCWPKLNNNKKARREAGAEHCRSGVLERARLGCGLGRHCWSSVPKLREEGDHLGERTKPPCPQARSAAQMLVLSLHNFGKEAN